MCEHEFESLRTADGSFCMTACRKCMKSTGEIETFCKAENRIAAANARIAEIQNELSIEKAHREKLLDEKYDEKGICLTSRLNEANARIAELEKTNQEQTSKMIFMETIFRMPHNVATGTGISFKIATMQEFNRAEMYKERAEQAEANFDDAKDKIAMMGAEIVRLSEAKEQAEAQCAELKQANSSLASAAIEQPPYKNDLLAQNKRMQTAINRYVIGNIELLDALKAALEEKP